jgi:hypothetical protein
MSSHHTEYRFLTTRITGFSAPVVDEQLTSWEETGANLTELSKKGWRLRQVLATPVSAENNVDIVAYTIILERDITTVGTPRP